MKKINQTKIVSKLKSFPRLFKKRSLTMSLGTIGIVLILLGAIYYFLLRDLPSPTKLSGSSNAQSTQIFDRNDTLLYTVYTTRNQLFVPLKEIPKHMQQATIAIEDKDFYRHGPIDLRGIVRAFYSTIFKKQLQGGSTITQQLVKNSLLSPERTLDRKVKEIILAFATEALYSKEKILEMYLNQSPYGGTAWGIEAASLMYFGKHAKDVSLAEAALLAGLPEAPTTLSPFGARPDLAKKRQAEVLKRMFDQGYITKEQREKALKEPLVYKKVASEIKAPHFSLYIRDLLDERYGKELTSEGGLKVKTSLDLSIQDFAQETVASEVAKLRGYRVSNGAAVVTNPATGEILAMVGSRDYFDPEIDGNVNVTLAFRQPGSSIKPINYAVGLIKGYTAATPFIDKATCFSSGPKPYCPVNYDGKYRGVINMRNSLANSINIPAVKMLKLNGLDAMIATASAMGIKTFTEPERYGLALTLGGGEVTMLDMATAYGVFANGGYRIDLHPILKVTDRHGKVLEEYKPPKSPIFGKRALPEGVAFIISDILADNGARAMAFGTNSELRIDKYPVSVKTGTTNDYKDNWTIGYTPSFVTTVWVGNNDNTAMAGLVSGVTGAAPIWNTIMTHLLEGTKPQPPQKPADVVGVSVCNVSGAMPSAEGSPDRCATRFEYFLRGKFPKNQDIVKQKVFVDKTTQDLAKEGQTDNVEEKEHLIATDPTGDRYCVDCPHPEASPSPTPTP